MQMLPDASITATVVGPAELVSQRQLLVQALGRLPASQPASGDHAAVFRESSRG
jgi:hypothetical protein